METISEAWKPWITMVYQPSMDYQQHKQNKNDFPKSTNISSYLKPIDAITSLHQEDGHGNGDGILDNEVLLDQTFRVWKQGQGLDYRFELGQGRDYRVELTQASLKLYPTTPSPGEYMPPICCICPQMK